MRFLTRAIGGLVLASITIGLIGLGVWRLQEAVGERGLVVEGGWESAELD